MPVPPPDKNASMRTETDTDRHCEHVHDSAAGIEHDRAETRGRTSAFCHQSTVSDSLIPVRPPGSRIWALRVLRHRQLQDQRPIAVDGTSYDFTRPA